MSLLEPRQLRQIAIVSRALARRDGVDYQQTPRQKRHQYRREAIITLLGNWTLEDIRRIDGVPAICRNNPALRLTAFKRARPPAEFRHRMRAKRINTA